LLPPSAQEHPPNSEHCRILIRGRGPLKDHLRRALCGASAAAVIPCLFASAYVIILALFFDPGGFANFSTLQGLASLQGSPWLLLAGWLHYLAFDLFVGAWQVRTARRDGMAHIAMVPSLILTFMVGPAGLLVFMVTRLLLRK